MEGDERKLVEAPALYQLKGLGWSHLDGTTLAPEKTTIRSSFKDVVLTPNLEQAIQRINPWISEDNLRKVIREVTLIQTSTLMEANQWLWERLTQYFSVDQDLGSGRRGQTLKLIDFDNLENNEFLPPTGMEQGSGPSPHPLSTTWSGRTPTPRPIRT
jgi:type I restriction enzyme R subunit